MLVPKTEPSSSLIEDRLAGESSRPGGFAMSQEIFQFLMPDIELGMRIESEWRGRTGLVCVVHVYHRCGWPRC